MALLSFVSTTSSCFARGSALSSSPGRWIHPIERSHPLFGCDAESTARSLRRDRRLVMASLDASLSSTIPRATLSPGYIDPGPPLSFATTVKSDALLPASPPAGRTYNNSVPQVVATAVIALTLLRCLTAAQPVSPHFLLLASTSRPLRRLLLRRRDYEALPSCSSSGN